nr:ATP-binding cassette domain-containing protein [Desulforamulus aquiferis]
MPRLKSFYIDKIKNINSGDRPMTLKNGPIIQFVDFSYAYSGTSFSALKSVDLLVEKGTFVGFTGPTGAGKTTLIKP